MPECEMLPPPPPVEDEKPLELFDLLARGSEFLDNYTDVSEAIVLLGNTGSGKSTLTQILAGNLSKLYSVITSGCIDVIIDEDNKIGLPSTKSKTLFPELFFKIDPNSSTALPLAFYDFPGFDDTRGDVQDIGANFFMNQVIAKVSSVKMLFLVIHSSVNFNERKDFDLLATHAATFVKNLEKYANSIALIVTKVASYNNRGQYIDDRTIISGIEEFLNKFLDELRSQLSNNPDQDSILLNKIIFVETLLRQDPLTNTYSKIWFVRSPLECGPLSEQEMIHNTKSNITKLYQDNLSYTGINKTTDFGFTLKAETKLVLANYTRSINSAISSAVKLVIDNLHNHYLDLDILVDLDNLNLTSLVRTLHENSVFVKSMVEKLENNISNSVELSNILKFSTRGLGYHVPSKFHSFMNWQEEYLTFFDQAVGEKQERSVDKWSEPIGKLNKALLDLVDWYEFCLVLETRVFSFPFQSTKLELPPKSPRNSWLNYIDTHQIVTVTRQIIEVASRIENRHLDILDFIMSFALENYTDYCDSTSNAIIFKGNFIQLSSLQRPSAYLTKCGNKTTQVHIYAAHTIFLDVELTLENFDLVMIAPNWINPHNLELNVTLGGKPALYEYQKAESGSAGRAGLSGCAGKAGGPGGAMFGLSSSIESPFPVTIASHGGKGGGGQEGGNGGRGSSAKDAKNPQMYSNYDPYNYRTKQGQPCTGCILWQYNRFERYGFSGNSGAAGGNGGMSGFGGIPVNFDNNSIVVFKNRDLIQVTSRQGENGLPGRGGSGGIGGQGGSGYLCYINCWVSWVCRTAYYGYDGNRGRNGEDGKSTLCRNAPEPPRELEKWPALVEYRKNFYNQTDLTTTTFFNLIDKRTETENLFTLKALAEESLALETLDRSDVNVKRLRDAYSSLISRLENFSKINYHFLSDEHKKITSMLLTLAYSSLLNFDRSQNYNVIVDVSYYFSVIERQISSLRFSTALKAIRESKETFTQNLKQKMSQAVGFIEDTVTPALDKAKTDLEAKVSLLEDQLVSMIEDTKLSLEEMKDKLRKANAQQGYLNFLKIFSVVGNILSKFIPIPGFSTFDFLVQQLQKKYTGHENELERLKEIVEEAEKLMEELEEKRDEFEKEFQPLIDSLLGYFKNVSESLNSGQEIERPQLLLTKWQVTTKLKEVKSSLYVFADSSLNLRALIQTIDTIQDAMTMTIDLYEMIEEYLETASLAEYISTVNSAQFGPIPINDPEYVHTVGDFEIRIKENLLDVEVKKAMHAFKQWVFPFAKFYFGGQSKRISNAELGAEHLQQVENLQLDLERYKAMSVGNQDTFIILTNFSSGLKTSKPFFTWNNGEWRDDIRSLMSGKSVKFQADVRLQGMAGWEAIKFKLIEINFKLNHAPEGMQGEFNDIIEYFGVSMTHSGVSSYRFQQDYFVMTGANQTLRYNFERDSNGNRLGTNQVYEKFKNGDFLLSPYTLWTFQLLNVVPLRKGKLLRHDVGFESLEKFLPFIDLELVGMGTYTDGEAAVRAANGDMQLDLYYERDGRISVDFQF